MLHYKTDKIETYCGITEASIAKKGNPSWNHWKLLSYAQRGGLSFRMVKTVAIWLRDNAKEDMCSVSMRW